MAPAPAPGFFDAFAPTAPAPTPAVDIAVALDAADAVADLDLDVGVGVGGDGDGDVDADGAADPLASFLDSYETAATDEVSPGVFNFRIADPTTTTTTTTPGTIEIRLPAVEGADLSRVDLAIERGGTTYPVDFIGEEEHGQQRGDDGGGGGEGEEAGGTAHPLNGEGEDWFPEDHWSRRPWFTWNFLENLESVPVTLAANSAIPWGLVQRGLELLMDHYYGINPPPDMVHILPFPPVRFGRDRERV